MSGPQHDPMADRIGRAAQRLAQLQAQHQLRHMKLAKAARARERKLCSRRWFQLGQAIDKAGFSDWEPVDVLGLVLVARDKYGDAESARRLMRERARQAAQSVPCGISAQLHVAGRQHDVDSQRTA